jgi:hypothetical protein
MIVTINYKGIEFDVHGTFAPAEKEVTYYSDGSGYPGCAASFEVEEIMFGGEDFWEILEDKIDEIEDLVLSEIYKC